MNYTEKLYRLGQRLYFKHLKSLAVINANELKNSISASLVETLHNASTIKSLGILPFERMAKEDGLTLSFDITRNDHLGNRTITVDNIVVLQPDKAYLQPKYQPLKDQIESYLQKNWEVYPAVNSSGEKIEYQDFTITLIYNQNPSPSQA